MRSLLWLRVRTSNREPAPGWITILAMAVLAFAAAPVQADTMNLAWDDCYGAGGLDDYTLGCTTGGPPATLYLSFELSDPLDGVTSIDFGFVVRADAASLPPFWQFATVLYPGLCNGGLTGSAGAAAACTGHMAPFATPTLAMAFSTPYDLDTRLGGFVGSLIPPAPGTTVDLAAGTPYFVVAVTIDPSWASEAGGSCDGCGTAMRFGELLTVNKISISPYVRLGTGSGASHGITGDLCVTANGGGNLSCAPTPTVPSTWGRLKSLYR